jgi:hypothetical protein
MKTKTVLSIGGIILLLLVAIAMYNYQKVPIEAQFPKKIVYTSHSDANADKLKQDCDNRGGTFNTCGSPCDPSNGPTACPAVCAFICILK